MPVTIYHNPRCSKSRQALQLLAAQQADAEVVEYLATPPDAHTLGELLELLGIEPRQLMRTQEAEYSELGLDNPKLTRQQLIAAMAAHPRLIERPIVVTGSGRNRRAVIGRPPEKILEIL